MRVVAVIGPAQAGKSTLIEAVAALDGKKSARLVLSGETAVTKFGFMDDPWAAIEVPGGADSLAHIPPVLAAADAAVVCVPAEADAAVLCAPYLRLAEEAGLPTYIFVNRIDAATDRMADIVSALQAFSAHAMVLRQVPIREGGAITGTVDLISERAWHFNEGTRSSLVKLPAAMRERESEARAELLEHLADYDDHLLEELIEDQKPLADELYDVATRVLQRHHLVPVLLGAAAHGNGLMRLMKSLRHEVPGVAATAARLGGGVVAVACLADHVRHLGKTVLVRALGPGVAGGARLLGDTIGSIVEIDARTALGTLAPGDIGLTVKTDHLHLGAPLCAPDGPAAAPGWLRPRVANHRWLAVPANERDEARLSGALARMAEIDPGLSIGQDTQTGQAILATQGPLHLRRALDKLNTVFGIGVETRAIPPALRETLTRPVETHHRHRKQSGGAGQFADVVIAIRPTPRGEGFVFSDAIKGGVVPRAYIPAVEEGVRDALREGPHGFPVVDVAVTLRDGKYHAVDSSDFAFRTAGRNAMREAMAEAGAIVLQPVERVTIQVPGPFTGALVPLVSGLKGQVLNFEGKPGAAGWDEFMALLPRIAEADLFNALGSATRGTAWFEAEFDHYEEVRGDIRTTAGATAGVGAG